jgi:integrase
MKQPSMLAILSAPRARAKTAHEAFAQLLERTACRVAAGVRSPATLRMQLEHATYLLERIGPQTAVADLSAARLAAALELEAQGRRRPLSGGTLRKRASTLRQAIELARGRAPALPEIPYCYQPKVAHLTDLDSYLRLLGEAPAHRREWLALALWTGQRRSDVERMIREDFDPLEPSIVVRSWKTRRFAGVRVHAAPALLTELGPRWLQLAAGEPLVIPWPSANSWLRRACARLRLPRLTTHSLRHSFFTWYVSANGFTPELLELGGWKDLTIPARVYAHAAPVRLREQIERTHQMLMGSRFALRKVSRKREPGPSSVGDVLDGIGGRRVGALRPPEPAHGLIPRGQEVNAPPSLLSDARGVVGPTGFEPVAYGLKVLRSLLPKVSRSPWVYTGRPDVPDGIGRISARA